MNPEVAKKWVAALRSGKYSQTSRNLRDHTGYCCLGVLCDLASKEGLGKWEAKDYDNSSPVYYFTTDRTSDRCGLPLSVVEWAGLRDGCGSFFENNRESSLIAMNDQHGNSFSDIAQTIQDKVETL